MSNVLNGKVKCSIDQNPTSNKRGRRASKTSTDNLIDINYCFFVRKIDEWRNELIQNKLSIRKIKQEITQLIGFLLNNMCLLVIECGSQDETLTIFETINDRGMPLSDADIFKASLMRSAGHTQRKVIVSIWESLKDHNELLKVLMHIYRAKAKDTSKERSLRKY